MCAVALAQVEDLKKAFIEIQDHESNLAPCTHFDSHVTIQDTHTHTHTLSAAAAGVVSNTLGWCLELLLPARHGSPLEAPYLY